MVLFLSVTFGALGATISAIASFPALRSRFPEIAAHCAWLGDLLAAIAAVIAFVGWFIQMVNGALS
jgi:hypothetical protein